MKEITLAVLAGGAGSRMGGPKGLLRLGGRPILQYLLHGYAWDGPTLLVTSPGRENPTGWELFSRQVVDAKGGEGPLRGVLTALENSQTRFNLIATVDMPLVAGEHLRWIAERAISEGWAGLMLKKDRVMPFPCFLGKELTGQIAARLAEGRRAVHGLSEIGGVMAIAAPDQWGETVWTNLNTPDDLATIEAGRA
jgi:molybdopterin-guanine dinucleotide biosynthesis protein A